MDRPADRQANRATKIDSQAIESLALSPDESQIAVTVRVPTRFTFGPGRRRWPVWSPDGRSIVFVLPAGGVGTAAADFLRKPSSGAGAEEMILHAGTNATPLDISPDGRLLVYSITGTNAKDDLWLLPLPGERTPTRYLDGPSEERHAQFSPDGHRIAYSSDESGQYQVYVQTVPATGDKRQISTQGGSRPRWRRDGKEPYYLSADGKLMAVPVKLGGGNAGGRRCRAALRFVTGAWRQRAFLYAPLANGQKFLASVLTEGSMPPVTISMNWMVAIGK